MSQTAFTAIFRKDPEDSLYWLVEIKEERRIHTHGKSLTEANERILEALSLWINKPLDDSVRVKKRLDNQEINESLDELDRLQEKLLALKEKLDLAVEDAVVGLRRELKLSIPDIATILEIPQNRVKTLLEKRKELSIA